MTFKLENLQTHILITMQLMVSLHVNAQRFNQHPDDQNEICMYIAPYKWQKTAIPSVSFCELNVVMLNFRSENGLFCTANYLFIFIVNIW